MSNLIAQCSGGRDDPNGGPEGAVRQRAPATHRRSVSWCVRFGRTNDELIVIEPQAGVQTDAASTDVRTTPATGATDDGAPNTTPGDGFWVTLDAAPAPRDDGTPATPNLTRAQRAELAAARLTEVAGEEVHVFTVAGSRRRGSRVDLFKATGRTVPDVPEDGLHVEHGGHAFILRTHLERPHAAPASAQTGSTAAGTHIALTTVHVIGLYKDALKGEGELVEAVLKAAGAPPSSPGAKLIHRGPLGLRERAVVVLPVPAADTLRSKGAFIAGTRESLTALPVACRPASWIRAARNRTLWLHNVRGGDAAVLEALQAHDAFGGKRIIRAGHLLSKKTGNAFGVVEVVLASPDDLASVPASFRLRAHDALRATTVRVSEPGVWLCYCCGSTGHDWRRCDKRPRRAPLDAISPQPSLTQPARPPWAQMGPFAPPPSGRPLMAKGEMLHTEQPKAVEAGVQVILQTADAATGDVPSPATFAELAEQVRELVLPFATREGARADLARRVLGAVAAQEQATRRRRLEEVRAARIDTPAQISPSRLNPARSGSPTTPTPATVLTQSGLRERAQGVLLEAVGSGMTLDRYPLRSRVRATLPATAPPSVAVAGDQSSDDPTLAVRQ